MEILSNPAVIWFLVGLGLLLLELVLPGFVVMFFGVGAWVTAISYAIFHPELNIQILIFLISSLLGLILLRKSLKKRFFDRTDQEIEDQLEEFIGRKALVIDDFANGHGMVEFKGTRWKAEGSSDLKAGDGVIVQAKEGLTLIVKPK